MPLELNDVLNDARWVQVQFGDHAFEVAYRPAATSMRRQSELKRTLRRMLAEGEETDIDESVEMAKVICEMVSDWDLQRDSRPLPINIETVQDLPGVLFNAIMEAISQDSQAEREEKKVSNATSAAGLPRRVNSEPAQNGIPQSERRGSWA